MLFGSKNGRFWAVSASPEPVRPGYRAFDCDYYTWPNPLWPWKIALYGNKTDLIVDKLQRSAVFRAVMVGLAG